MKIELTMKQTVVEMGDTEAYPGDERTSAPLNPACVVCGSDNPHGLQIAFASQADGVVAEWIPREGWESFRGIIHGGVISAVLDEAMSQAIIATGRQAFTAELRLRFKEKIRVGDRIQVRGWVLRTQKRLIKTEACLCEDSGHELAHAWGSFVAPRSTPDRQALNEQRLSGPSHLVGTLARTDECSITTKAGG